MSKQADSIHKIHEYFAARLRAEREKQGLSMLTVAERAGISQQMVSYLERGIRNPSLDTLMRICEVLNIHFPTLAAGAWAEVLPQAPKKASKKTG